jgi:hypothetical protein
VDSLEEGRFVITASTTSSIEIDIHKDYYRNETVSVNITDYPEFPELYYQVRLQPDLRSGTVNVRELSGNKGIDAKVTVTNLDIRDDETAVSSKTTGKYEFGLRKNCKYSISVTLPGHSYFYTVWKADINRVSQTLNVNPVRLEDLSRIPVSYLVFGEGESALSPEASGELQCIAGVLRDNPSYNAVISLYHTAAEAEIVQQRRKNIITFMDLSRTPGSRYRIEPVQVSQPKLPDISFNAVQTANTNTNK